MEILKYPSKRQFSLPDEIVLQSSSDLKSLGWVAGGAILSFLKNAPTADYDIYPSSKDAAADILYQLMEDHGGYVLHATDRAITIKTNTKVDHYNPVTGSNQSKRCVYQIIYFQDWKSPEHIFETFDFSPCMVAWDIVKKEIVCSDSFIRSMATNQVEFSTKTAFPIASLTRIQKYRNKGFSFPKKEILRMGLTVAKSTPPKSWDDLNAMLGGYYGKQITLLVKDNTPFSIDNAIDVLSDAQFHESDGTTTEFPTPGGNNMAVYESIVRRDSLKMFNLGEKNYVIIPGHGSTPSIIEKNAKFGQVEWTELVNLKDCTSFPLALRLDEILICLKNVHPSNLTNIGTGTTYDDKSGTVTFDGSQWLTRFPTWQTSARGFGNTQDTFIRLNKESSRVFICQYLKIDPDRVFGMSKNTKLYGEVMDVRDSGTEDYQQTINIDWSEIYDLLK